MPYNQSFEIINVRSATRDEQYEDCEFLNCDFSRTTFNNCTFNDCIFENCNLSMVQLRATQLDHVSFVNCKLLGVDFSLCTDFLFSVNFKNCILNYANFYQKDLSKSGFEHCTIIQADFTECNLQGVAFKNTDLHLSVFETTDLTKADLSSARNYAIDPTRNTVKKAHFSLPGVLGLLHNYDIILEENSIENLTGNMLPP